MASSAKIPHIYLYGNVTELLSDKFLLCASMY